MLLNSVLASIPILDMSLFKMLMALWKKIVQIQMNFLWGGTTITFSQIFPGMTIRLLKQSNPSLDNCLWENIMAISVSFTSGL